MAWDKTKPADNEKLKDIAALIRANWEAIEALTDAALQITNAKIAAGAAIADTKLAQITTAGKVSGSALTGLASIPSGAGLLPVANIDHGTTANKILKLDASAKIPAVDGSQVTHLNGSAIDSGTVPAANVETGTTANKILKLDANAKIPAVDGSQLTNLPKADGEVVKMAYVEDGSLKTITGGWAFDDSKPQISEGTDYSELHIAHALQAATNYLILEAVINVAHGIDVFASAGIFQSGGNDVIAVAQNSHGQSGGEINTITVRGKFLPATTDSVTYSVRLSANNGSMGVNGSGTRYYGGALLSSLKIMEVKASA